MAIAVRISNPIISALLKLHQNGAACNRELLEKPITAQIRF
jgi:hypothetical protein